MVNKIWMNRIAIAGGLVALFILIGVLILRVSEIGVYLLVLLCLAQSTVMYSWGSSLTTRRTQLAQQRQRLDDQLRESAAQAERNRLARDLHDTIKQQLFSINVVAATAQSLHKQSPQAQNTQDIADCISEVRSLTQAAMGEMKALLTQLRPNPLDNVGLLEAIREQLEALHFRSEVATELHCTDLPDSQRLPIGAQESLFRAIQETLSNIARHARASKVWVTITHDEKHLKIEIADDGQGFEPKQVQAGMGLSNIRTRLADLNGSTEIDSTLGVGTRVRLALPLFRRRPLVDEKLVEQRYHLVRLLSLVGMAMGMAVSYFAFAQTNFPFAVASVVVLLAGLLAAVNLGRRLQPLFPSDYTYWHLCLDVGFAVVIGIGLLGLTGLFANQGWRSYAICLTISMLGWGLALLRIWQLRHTIHEWTTAARERATWRSLQWMWPMFIIVQLLWFFEHHYAPPFATWLDRYFVDNRFWYAWLLFMIMSAISARLNLYWLQENYRAAGIEPPTTIPTSPVTVEPYSNANLEAHRMQWLAKALALLYLPVGVTLTGWLLSPKLDLSLWWGGASLSACVVVLLCKWRVEAWLTNHLAEWTTPQAQREALAFYRVMAGMSLFLPIGGLVGGVYGYFFADSTPMAAVAVPGAIITILLAWLIAPIFYYSMMSYLSELRVKLLECQ